MAQRICKPRVSGFLSLGATKPPFDCDVPTCRRRCAAKLAILPMTGSRSTLDRIRSVAGVDHAEQVAVWVGKNYEVRVLGGSATRRASR